MRSMQYVDFEGLHGALITDLSEAGAGVLAAVPMRSKQRVRARLDLGTTTVAVVGQIVSADQTGRAGLQFVSMSDEDRQRLKDWLFENALSRGIEVAAPVDSRNDSDFLHELEEMIGPFADLMPGMSASEPEPEPAPVPIQPSPVEVAVQAPPVVRPPLRIALADLPPATGPALAQIAKMARECARGDGAAIALSRAGVMRCSARDGDIAPELGVPLDTRASFSGQCIRSAMTLVCDDSEVDDRVDAEVCRQFDIRSILATPVRLSDRVIGVLEVFSRAPQAFGDDDIRDVERLSEVLGEVAAREAAAVAARRAASTAPAAPPKPATTPAMPPPAAKVKPITARPAASVNAPASAIPTVGSFAPSTESARPPISSRPAAPAAAPLPKTPPPAPPQPVVKETAPAKAIPAEQPAPATPPRSQPAAAASPVVPSAQPHSQPTLTSPPSTQVAPSTPASAAAPPPPSASTPPAPATPAPPAIPAAPAVSAAPTSAPPPKPAVETARTAASVPFSSYGEGLGRRPAATSEKAHPHWLIPALAASLILGTLGGGYWMLQRMAAPASPTTVPTAPAPSGEPSHPAATAPGAQPQTLLASAAGASAAPSALTTVNRTTTPVPGPVPGGTRPRPRSDIQPAVTLAPSTPASPRAAAGDEAPPALAGNNGRGNIDSVTRTGFYSLPTLRPNAPAPAAPTTTPRSSGTVRETRLISSTRPNYPEAARRLLIEGNVSLTLQVSAEGRVTSVKVNSGNAILAASAVQAARGWRYEPAALDGKPIASTVDVTVRFARPNQ